MSNYYNTHQTRVINNIVMYMKYHTDVLKQVPVYLIFNYSQYIYSVTTIFGCLYFKPYTESEDRCNQAISILPRN